MEKKYISVFALNKYIKAKMDQDISLQNIYIQGEISNYRPHPSGHLYFTLKDENSKVGAVMFSSYAKQLDFSIENGMQVLMKASVSVYEKTGQYQLYVHTMQEDGIGNLYLKYEKLKQSLEKEGLFDVCHKKEIVHFPKSIAVLSAKQGAAVQDVIKTIRLRFPFVNTVVFPVPVQGDKAYLKIIETLKQVDKIGFDTIILARGGGSIEDLWNFNEEALVRCIFDLKTPLITGIGHETDFTICDFVSDYRGVTPTAAAIKATPDQVELRKHLILLTNQLTYKMKSYLSFQQKQLNHLQNSYYLKNPEYIYSNELLRLIHLQDQLSYQFQIFQIKVDQDLKNYQRSLKDKIDSKVSLHCQQYQLLISKLDSLSPLKVMQRGYTLIKKDDCIVKNGSYLNKGDIVHIIFNDEEKEAEIK
ncbi:MAG: exodeoxyribonuclease VII large subunit [Coprobacillus sp.]|nr:exodeoxyribonuclease VII large subunit [Coprobacillus sp.]